MGVGSTRAWSGLLDHTGERGAIFCQKSPKNRRYTGFSSDLFIKSPIYRLSPIFWPFLVKNRPADMQYIGDISPIFFDFFLLGYSPLHKSYRYLNPISNWVHISWHVVFNESCFLFIKNSRPVWLLFFKIVLENRF